jgi:polyphosphate kinase
LPSGIRIKTNSIVDEAIIDALYRASNAGVPIDLVVRGICALKPGVEGLSENIRVRSVLGRYLEHSRVFSFVNGGDPHVFIGSADLMHRNLDRRVEALVRIASADHLAELDSLFDLAMSDETASWWLEGSGEWMRHDRSADGTRLQDQQEVLMRRISQRKRAGSLR